MTRIKPTDAPHKPAPTSAGGATLADICKTPTASAAPSNTVPRSFKQVVLDMQKEADFVFNNHNGEAGYGPVDSSGAKAYSQGQSQPRKNKPT